MRFRIWFWISAFVSQFTIFIVRMIASQTRFSTDFASSSLCHILFAERFQNHAIERFGHIMLAQRHRDVVPGAIHHRLHDLGDVL